MKVIQAPGHLHRPASGCRAETSTYAAKGKNELHESAKDSRCISAHPGSTSWQRVWRQRRHIEYLPGLSTIQAGIDAAQNSDTVLVGPGTYVECLQIDYKWSITVASSAGPEATIIDAGWKGAAATIFGAPCTLQGFTLQNGIGMGTAIVIRNSYPTITGNIFAANMSGAPAIYVFGESSPLIEGNTFLNSSSINIGEAASIIITNNLILNNSCAAIELIGAGRSQVTNNTIVGNDIGIYVYFNYSAPSPICKNNIMMGNNTAVEVETLSGVTDQITWQNNLLYGNTVNYSGVSDQTGINGNISADPVFSAPAVDNFHLHSGSPHDAARETRVPSMCLQQTLRNSSSCQWQTRHRGIRIQPE